MSTEATDQVTAAATSPLVQSAMAQLPSAVPAKEAVADSEDTPGEPTTASLTESIEKLSLAAQQPTPISPPMSLEHIVKPRIEEKDEEASTSMRNLIINYLPPNLTEGNLATLFSPYGTLEECKIVIDLETGRSRGYGFVKYLDDKSAARAKQHLNGYQMDNKRLKVAYARKQCKEIQNANLYVTNIPPHYSEGQLKELFDAYGEIIECRILRNENGASRGVGFVRLDTHVHAMTALQDRDGHICEDGAAPLVVKLAQRRKRNYWNTGDTRGPGPRPGGGRESASPGQSGHNPRYSNGMGGRRVGGMGGPSGHRDYMQSDFQDRRRDDRDRDRGRDLRGSPGFRGGRGRGGFHGFNGQRQRGRGGPSSMRRLNYRPVQSGPPPGMSGMHGPPSGSMGSGRMQQPQQYRPSGRGVPGPYGRGNQGVPPLYDSTYNGFVNAPPGGFYPPPPPPPGPPAAMPSSYSQPKNSNTTAFSLVVKNIPEYYTIDHLIALYAPFGPIHSVNIDPAGRRESDKPPFGVVTFFYFDDAKKARVETNERTIDNKELDVAFESKSQ